MLMAVEPSVNGPAKGIHLLVNTHDRKNPIRVPQVLNDGLLHYVYTQKSLDLNRQYPRL